MKVSRTIAYAVQAILQLSVSPPGRPVACSRLAADGRMPERFLLQVLRGLVRSGVLRSVRGVDGGYVLARTPSDITLLDVFEAMDTPIIPSVPPLEGLPDAARSKLLEVMNRVAASARRELAGVTLAELRETGDFSPSHGFGPGTG